MDDILGYVTEGWSTTDEGNPAEGGWPDRSKSSESTSPSGSRGVVQEVACTSLDKHLETLEVVCTSLDKHLEMSEGFNSKDNSSSPGGPESSNPFEIEPGHFDFLQVADLYSSRQFSSDFGAGKSSSVKDDSCSSSRRHSNQSASTSGSVGNSRLTGLSHFKADCIQQRVASPKMPCDNLAIEHSCESARIESVNDFRIEAANDFTQPNLSRVPPIRRVGEQPSRSIQPFVTQYPWNEIEAMTGAVNNQLLGRGGFGPVYMGILPNKKQVAVKILDDKSSQGESEFQNEVDLLSHLNHKNLVKLVGYCLESSKLVLVYEYAEEGTLWDHIHGEGSSLDWRTRLRVSLESACALEYLHTLCSPRIIHRDIKSSNILLTKQFVAKLADFGLSKLGKIEDENQTHISTVIKGTPGYLDPEYHKTGQLNEKSDIYSFGVVLLEIISGRNALEKNSEPRFIGDWVKVQCKSSGPKGVADKRLDGHYNIKSMRAIVTLALKCLQTSAKERPDIRKVVEELRRAIALEENTQQSFWSLKSLLGQ